MFQDIFNWFLILIGIVGIVLLAINFLLVESPKMDENIGNSLDYLEKSNPFECGFDSFRQSTNPVPIPFILIALLFLPFDLEVSSMLPYIVSSYSIGLYGLIFFIIFLLILVVGFAFELNCKAIALFKFVPKTSNKSMTVYL
uniref:NADH-ubiquinone oxidoreductase chain 3 n=1 Tax=Brettanomyces custersianus TaxID=13368 RepID=C7FEX0_BRECS|nr:Nad3p [Brettanomyces custersianus]ACU32827.1 Nad3p [Brettanomyces custersianus]